MRGDSNRQVEEGGQVEAEGGSRAGQPFRIKNHPSHHEIVSSKQFR